MKEYIIEVCHPVIAKVQANSYEEAISMIRAQYRLPLSQPYTFTLVEEEEPLESTEQPNGN